MSEEKVTIHAYDGFCDAYVLTPDEGEGPWPAVIVYLDAFGIRPGLIDMAKRLAGNGYVVLLPDLFYRFGEYGPYDPKEVLKGDFRATVGPMMATTDNHKAAEDTAFFLAYLDARPDVVRGKVGTVGFCMGGGMAVMAAAYYPDRVAAAASFHGGKLATDDAVSAHLQLSKVKGELYIAAADEDHSYPPEMAEKFQAAMKEAGVKHTHEFYEGKKHGWMKPDLPVYDEEGAEGGWKAMLDLFKRNLR